MALVDTLTGIGNVLGGLAGIGSMGSQVVGNRLASEDNRRNIEFQRQTNRENREYQDKVNERNYEENWLMNAANQAYQDKVNRQNRIAQENQNVLNRRYQDIANRQMRRWALQDFDRVNRYNHPKAQMARYAEAGLNPNLIYGQSNMTSPVTVTKASTVPGVAARGHGIRGSAGQGQGIRSIAPHSERKWMFDPSVIVDIIQRKVNTLNMLEQNRNLHEQNVLLRQQAGAASAEARYKLAKIKALEYGALGKYGTRLAEYGEKVMLPGVKKVAGKVSDYVKDRVQKVKNSPVVSTAKNIADTFDAYQVKRDKKVDNWWSNAAKNVQKTGGKIWSGLKNVFSRRKDKYT